ncbi:hypothetical protein H6G00_01390 [Leptolyngbya sp. FACHB-541]|uniref:hypothetical protein n=1 Tax=Leptolyngbya sp. FACHB-541 TaxID=2692810 RepID=UPI00168459A4|nr:hypothetical protein [Leptolyngbya sp. FACHB-541]MBD1995283.1 hypothetical protein [Leptolyngbya sp. FACHB-541]
MATRTSRNQNNGSVSEAGLTELQPVASTRSSRNRSNMLHTIEQYEGDFGNRVFKYPTHDGRYRKDPAFFKKYRDGDPDEPFWDEQTNLLEMDDSIIQFGRGAEEMGGKPIFQYEGRKSEMALQILLACLDSPYPETKISRLVLPVPTTKRGSEYCEGIQQCAGTHVYKRNGEKKRLTIEQAISVDEGFGTFLYCKKNKLIHRPDELTAVISLGGKDLFGRVFQPNGKLIRKYEFRLKGTFGWAQELEPIISNKLGRSANLSRIMNCLRDRNFVYEEGNHSIDFSGLWSEIHAEIIDDLIAQIDTVWSRLTLPQTFIVGGSSSYLASLVSEELQIYYPSTDTQTVDVEGLKYFAELSNNLYEPEEE